MPRPGGESDKLGNHYEAVWTVECLLDVYLGRYESITLEAVGEDSRGVEFHLEMQDGRLQFHSVKRQKTGGDWTLAGLTKSDSNTGRSILGDLLAKREKSPACELLFISATGANNLRELCERAEHSTSSSDFNKKLSEKLRYEFQERVVKLCKDDEEFAFAAMKSTTVVLEDHQRLIHNVEQRIDVLFYATDGGDIRPDEIRRDLAEFAIKGLGNRIASSDVQGFLESKGLGSKDWKTDPAIKNLVSKVNRQYKLMVEAELINSSHIARDEVKDVVNAIVQASNAGVVVTGAGGFGKSCLLVQALSELEGLNIPYLCIRLDALEPCQTTRQLGSQLDLPRSPAVVLAGVADSGPSVLVVDQVDAMSLVSGRNPQLWEVFQQLVEDVRAYPGMKLLLACRNFDLEHDHRLRALQDESSGFTKIELRKLSEENVKGLLGQAAISSENIDCEQIDILSIPFHMLLFLEGEKYRRGLGLDTAPRRWPNFSRLDFRCSTSRSGTPHSVSKFRLRWRLTDRWHEDTTQTRGGLVA